MFVDKEDLDKLFLLKNYNELKFEYRLSVELLKDDNELFMLLLSKIKVYQEEINSFRGEDDERGQLQDRIDELEGEVKELEGELSDLQDMVWELNKLVK